MVGYAILGDSIPIAIPVHNGFLPLAEAVQGFPSMVVNLQCGLILGEENQPGHQDIDNIAQTRVLEKFGNLTIFMMARMYCSMSRRPWYPTIILSATTRVST